MSEIPQQPSIFDCLWQMKNMNCTHCFRTAYVSAVDFINQVFLAGLPHVHFARLCFRRPTMTKQGGQSQVDHADTQTRASVPLSRQPGGCARCQRSPCCSNTMLRARLEALQNFQDVVMAQACLRQNGVSSSILRMSVLKRVLRFKS